MTDRDRKLLRQAVLETLRKLEAERKTANEERQKTLDCEEHSLLACLDHDVNHESLAERIIEEYKALKGQSDG